MSQDNTPLTPGGMPLTMSSLEIAERTGKRHDNVMRDARAMLVTLHSERGVLSFEETHRNPQNGQEYPIFNLPKRECLTLVSGYSVQLRAAIIDRWMELEAAPAPFVIPRTLGEALRLAADQQDVIETQRAQIEADKPKTGFYDQFINADGLYGLQNAARALNCRPNLFTRWLKEKFMFYQGTALVPRVQYIQMGIFEVKSTIVEDKARPQTYVTPKGIEYLSTRVPDHIRMGRAA